MIEVKLIKSGFDENTGVSFATCYARGYEMTGYAYTHEDDMDSKSKYFGCHLADLRAQIKVLKKIHKDKKMACDECRKFVKALEQYKAWPQKEDKDSTARIVYRQLNKRVAEVNSIAMQINHLELEIQRYLAGRDIVSKYINKAKIDNQ